MSEQADKVIEAYQRSVENPVQVTELDQVPTTYENTTTAWWTKVICKDIPGAEVVSFKLDVPDDGSSNRRRIFLSYNSAGNEAGLPETVFCKAAESLENRIVLGVSDTARAEAAFFNKVYDRLDINIPHCYYANFDPETYAYIIVMEDLGKRAYFVDERTQLTYWQATELVTTLAKLHATFYQSPELGTESLPFKTWPVWWRNQMEGAPDFGSSCMQAFEDARVVIPPRLFKRKDEIWPATEASVARHNELPHSLIHCDVHLKNWFLTDTGIGLTDWQVVSIGHWSRDFAFSTTTSLTVDQRRQWGEKLLLLYLEKMHELGVPPISYDEALLNVRQQLMTALAFWTITLRPAPGMPPMQPERTTYEFLYRLTTAIDDLDVLDAF